MSKSSAQKRISERPDCFLLIVSITLIALGVLILASVSFAFSSDKFGDIFYALKHQIIWGLIPGLIVGVIFYKINLTLIKKYAFPLLLLTLVLMVMVFLPIIGIKSGGASRWINLGPITFQPSELLKLAFILYLAAWLSAKFEKNASKEFKQNFFSFLMIIGVIGLILFFQSDISTLGIIVLTAILIYFCAETPIWQTILVIAAGLGGLFAFIHLAPYRLSRIQVFLNPDLDPMGKGYQIKQALIAIGSGGTGGVGLGMSSQKFGFLPESVTDSIFAIFAEETGFIGATILICLFLIFLWRGFIVAKNSQDKFSQLAALGITFWIIVQAFVNIGAMIRLLPVTGIPLPFISYGGSALCMELIGLGILLNISKQRK